VTAGRTVFDVDPDSIGPSHEIGRSRKAHQSAPWWLWVGALALVAPIGISILALLVRAVGATEAAWATLFSYRTVMLIGRSFALTALVTVTATVIGVSGAWVLSRTDIGFKRLWGVAFAMPLVIPSYVLAMVIVSASGPRGLIADLTGIELPFVTGLVGAWLTLSLATYPYVFLITSAAIGRIDPALEEAARGLGASPSRVFRTVVLPQMRPAVGAGALLAALYTLSDFGAVSLMRFDAFTRVIYAQYSGRLDRTPAIVLSIVLILIAGVVIAAEQRTRGKGTLFTSKPSRAPSVHRLVGAQRMLSVGAIAIVVAFGALFPIATLIGWITRGATNGADISIPWHAIGGSLTGGTLSAITAVIFTVPIVVLIVRYSSRRTVLLERSIFVGFSLPHITVAIAVVAFTITWAAPVYQSLGMLVAVFAAMFLAQSVSAAKASLAQIDPAVEEASRSLGRGPFATLMAVTVPLMKRGLLAGAALVFVTTLKELPATLLLSPPGFSTLAVRIWSSADELLYARAATSSLILIAVSVLPLYYLSIKPREIVD
jgi:iron(III) transport system permease protein